MVELWWKSGGKLVVKEVEKAKELLKKKDKKSALTCMKRKVCAYTCG